MGREKEHGLQGFVLGSKISLKEVDDCIWNQMQGIVNLWKLEYYKSGKRYQSGLE